MSKRSYVKTLFLDVAAAGAAAEKKWFRLFVYKLDDFCYVFKINIIIKWKIMKNVYILVWIYYIFYNQKIYENYENINTGKYT